MSEAENTVVNTERPRRWYARWYVWVTALAVLALAVVLLFALLRHQKKQERVTTINTAVKSANADIAKGDYQAAYETLKQVEAKKQATDEEVVGLYGQLAAAASNTGDIGTALEYYKKRHELDPSTIKVDAYLMGVLYERTNDISAAIEQYAIAVQYLQSLPKSQETISDVNGVAAHLKELQEQQ